MLPKPFFAQEDKNLRLIGFWLLTVAVLVFVMILVGGATRLTESGLSMVDWKPISGTIPPMSEEAWQAEFEAYQQYPEYQLVNRGMSLDEFKNIFWWEYGHRLLGRLIGLVFALPLLYFLARRMIPPNLKLRMFGLLALGGAQGFLGWYMVQSGLVYEPAVSHLRLLAHLLLAVAVLSALLWTSGQILQAPRIAKSGVPGLDRFMVAFTIIVGIQIGYGALVAGLDAGKIFNTWPYMRGWFGSLGVWRDALEARSFIDNPVMVQFVHRIIAYLIFVLALMPWGFALYYRKSPACEKALSIGLAGLVVAQIALGIATLLMEVPVTLGVLHQGVGITLFIFSLYFVFALRGKHYGQ